MIAPAAECDLAEFVLHDGSSMRKFDTHPLGGDQVVRKQKVTLTLLYRQLRPTKPGWEAARNTARRAFDMP